MPSLDTLQFRLINALRSAPRDKHVIDTLEIEILQHHETRTLVRQRAAYRRGLTTVPYLDKDHTPGVLRKHTIHRNGKRRTVFSPGDADYCQAQYYQMGIIGPIADDSVHPNTYAYTTGRGIDQAISMAIKTTMTNKDCVWSQEDIHDCFNSVPTLLAEPTFPPLTWECILKVRHRHRELTQATTGLPQGHPVSASVINVIINTLLEQVRQAYTHAVIIIIYSDDLTIIGPREAVKTVRAEIRAILAAYGMKLNPEKSRIARPVQGHTLGLLGYEIEWLTPHSSPLIRPRRKAYGRLEEALANSANLGHAKTIERGWLNAYRLTNDPQHLQRMKLAIERGMNRWRASTHRNSCPDHGGNR